MKNKLKNYLVKINILLFILIICAHSVSAHDMDIDIVGRSIIVKATYSDGKPVANADIVVYHANGKKYLSGTTDDGGEYSFEVGENTAEELIVEVEQTGHKSSVTIDLQSVNKESDDFFIGFKIIAGIGYLFGIAGVISYYMSWKMKKK